MELYVPRLLPSLPQHLFFLILAACCASLFPFSLCLDAQYQYCQNTSKCGSILDIWYPFGVGNRGCGLPNLQINCVMNSSPVIEIKRQNYTILQFPYLDRFYQSHDMPSHPPPDTPRHPPPDLSFAIVRGEKCKFLDDPSYSHMLPPQHTDTALRIGNESWTLNVYKCNKQVQFNNSVLQPWKCNATVYYSFFDNWNSTEGCSKRQVTVDVGLMKPISNDGKRDESCRSCAASAGICGYKTSDSTAAAPFVCYCKDGPRTDKCLGHGSLNKSANINIIIGCSVGGTALAAIALLLFSVFHVKKRKSPPHSSTSKVEKFLEEYAYQMPMPTRYSQSDLKKITNNFAEKLGEGGFGVVYKGKLWNGALVAVKLLDRHRHSENQFLNEVATIGRVHHFNLVRLLGYCFESFTSAVVYEYMLNGSLEKFIFARKEKGRILRWEQLYSIALGAARGIAYLHQDCDKRIIHFDIKPHNILLDSEFTPKVSDFGLAKLCGKGADHISITCVRGTPGYVAPEVCDSGMGPVTDKSDVYSFGMLLFEIVGERKNIDVQVTRSSRLYFPEWAFKMLENEELGRRLGGEEIEAEDEDEEKARRLMTKIGLWCIQYNYRDRPNMSRVVQMLEGNGDDVGNPPFPFNSSSATPEIPVLCSTGEIS